MTQCAACFLTFVMVLIAIIEIFVPPDCSGYSIFAPHTSDIGMGKLVCRAARDSECGFQHFTCTVRYLRPAQRPADGRRLIRLPLKVRTEARDWARVRQARALAQAEPRYQKSRSCEGRGPGFAPVGRSRVENLTLTGGGRSPATMRPRSVILASPQSALLNSPAVAGRANSGSSTVGAVLIDGATIVAAGGSSSR